MFKSPAELPVNRMYDEYYWVRYNYLHSRTREDLSIRGVRQSDMESFNRSTDREMVKTQLNISQMFDLFNRGVTVNVINYNDTAKIYEVVHTHLRYCRDYITTAIHGADEDFVRELIELDDFASRVYDKAISVFSDEDVFNFNATGLPFVQRLNAMNVFKRKQNKILTVTTNNTGVSTITTQKDQEEKIKIQERTGMRDSFASHLDQLSGWKKPNG